MDFNQIPAGVSIPDDFNAIIEIPTDAAPVKYEADKTLNLLRVDRFLTTSMRYPVNYGFVPHTLSKDGDPVDVLVFTPAPLIPGALVRCRPLGLLKMTDEAGPDAKILAVPIDKVCAMTAPIKTLDDVPAGLLRQIEHFFANYKTLEQGKWVKIDGWGTREDARRELIDSAAAYQAPAA